MYFQGNLEHLIYKNYVLQRNKKKTRRKRKQNIRFINNDYSVITNHMSWGGEKKIKYLFYCFAYKIISKWY